MPEVVLQDQHYTFVVERSRRKTIAASVDPEGTILVSAPYIVPEFMIRHFLKQKESWLLKRIHLRQTATAAGLQLSYKSGDVIPFFDSSHVLTVTRSEQAERPRLYFLQNTFQAIIPVHFSEDQEHQAVKEQLHSWYLHNTLPVLEKRVEYYAGIVGVEYKDIRVKDVTSHWGSCSSNRNLNFNYRIAMLPVDISDYIIVHELCHIKEMNHSPRFWALVGQVIPHYKQLRTQLKQNHMFLD